MIPGQWKPATPGKSHGYPWRWQDAGAACLLALLAIAVRIIPAWQLKAIVNDVSTYLAMGDIVLRGDNLYAQRESGATVK